MALQEVAYVTGKLQWMQEREIWPNGLRYLWTDAFGLVLYLSLYEKTGEAHYLRAAGDLVAAVYRVLGRRKGLRIGEEADRDGQYFHYLAQWLFALHCFARYEPGYREEALKLVRDIHPAFVIPGLGVIWKMREDLSAPYPGYGLGAMDAYDACVVYKLLDATALAPQIAEVQALIDQSYHSLDIDQDLGLGMMLWLAHFFPEEPWARHQRHASLTRLEQLWIDPPGYFCRQRGHRNLKFAFTNYGIALGLQAAGVWPQRVGMLNKHFETWRSGDDYDSNAITHVMACTAHFPGLFLSAQASESMKYPFAPAG